LNTEGGLRSRPLFVFVMAWPGEPGLPRRRPLATPPGPYSSGRRQLFHRPDAARQLNLSLQSKKTRPASRRGAHRQRGRLWAVYILPGAMTCIAET